MASLFDIANSGLQSYRKALSVTGQNIGNINTEGFKRREANLEEVTSGTGGVQNRTVSDHVQIHLILDHRL